MAFGKPKARRVDTSQLPGPIATSYRRIFTRHEPDVERLIFILDTAEITARFLAATVLCTLRSLAEQGKLDAPLIDIGDPGRLRKPSFGLWMEILREGTRRLSGEHDLFPDEGSRSFVDNICRFVFDEKESMKGRPYADLDALLVIRNQVHHPKEELDIPALCSKSEELLNGALEQLAFFEGFPPYVVKQIHTRRRRLSDVEYDHQCFLLQGEIDFPTATTDERSWHTETSEVLIYQSDNAYLNLDPLFIYVHSDEVDRSKADELSPGMYSFAGFAKKSGGLVVEYLPCAGSSMAFKTSTQAFTDDATVGYLNKGVAELIELLESKNDTNGAG